MFLIACTVAVVRVP